MYSGFALMVGHPQSFVFYFHSSWQIPWLSQHPVLHWANCLLLCTSGCILDPSLVDLVWYAEHNCPYSIRIDRRCDLFKTHCLCKQHYYFCENIDLHWIRCCCVAHRRHNILAFPNSNHEKCTEMYAFSMILGFPRFSLHRRNHDKCIGILAVFMILSFPLYHTTEEIIINALRSIHLQWFWASHASHSTEEIIKL